MYDNYPAEEVESELREHLDSCEQTEHLADPLKDAVANQAAHMVETDAQGLGDKPYQALGWVLGRFESQLSEANDYS